MDGMYSMDQVIGKTLYANEAVNVYSLPDTSSSILFTVKTGDLVGSVYSYILRDGKLWWMLQPSGQLDKYGYVIHETNRFSESIIREQGSLTIKEVEEAKKLAEMSTLETVGYYIKQLLYIAVPATLVYLAYKIYSIESQKK